MSNKDTQPKILVIGSSGILARHIINEVIHSFGIDSLCLSDYKPERLKILRKHLGKTYGKAPESRVIDITSLKSIRHGIEAIDYVLVPASQKQPLVQEICIENGIICIDLSVSEKFIDNVLKLQAKACQANSLLLVAAGLFPGLSGIIAKQLHENARAAIIDIGLIQSKDGMAGRAGIADMLQLFNQKVEHIRSTGLRVKNGFRYSKSFWLDDKFGTKNLRLANFIERKYLKQRLGVNSNYWSAFDSEYFNKLIALLKITGFLKLFENQKYRLKAAHFISKRKKEAEEEIAGIVGQTDKDNRFFVSLTSDYGATASCAVAFIKILEQRDQKECGVYFPFELFALGEVLPYIDHQVIK